MLTEASIPTAHGSSHGLVPQVQYSEHFSSPDIHTHHHSAPSTIFTPGESLSTDPHLISGPGPSTVTQDEPIDEVMMPDKSDGPDSHSCSCLLVWNSVKDYWERLYGSVVYSITKLLIGMLLSVASPKSVRAQGRTFTFVVGRFWGLCSVFIIPGMPVWIRRLKVVDRSFIHPRWALTMQDTCRTLTPVMKIKKTKMPLIIWKQVGWDY